MPSPTGTNGVTAVDDSRPHAYTIHERPLGEPLHRRIITIGAGAAGLNLARQIDKYMENVDHVIYEKNADVGGTWFENRYPGCACDIPSHNYQFTWEPSAEWTHLYGLSSQPGAASC
jgi:cation diffusion facilitator CzcD-associated flavoprotein CzcO